MYFGFRKIAQKSWLFSKQYVKEQRYHNNYLTRTYFVTQEQ